MKRFAMGLASTLALGALAIAPAMAQATFRLAVDPTSSSTLNAGDTLTLDMFISDADPINAYQGIVIFDPLVFDNNQPTSSFVSAQSVGFDSTSPSAKVSPVINGTTYKAINFGQYDLNGTTTTLTGDTLVHKLSFKVLAAPKTGSSDLVFSDVLGVPTRNSAKNTYSPAANVFNTPIFANGGKVTVTVPGPSSLAVFAMGGMAPIMGLLRRRRFRASA